MSRLLLDTCVLLYMMGEPARLSQSAQEALQHADELLVAWATPLEISIKVRVHQARPERFPEFTIEVLEKTLGWIQDGTLKAIPIDAATVRLVSNGLRGPTDHGDPFDWWIIGTSISHKLPLISSDQKFPDYAGAKIIW